MLLKGLFFVCIQAIFVKVALCQCIGSPLLAAEALVPTNMALSSLAPITPVIGRVIGGNLFIDTKACEPLGVSIFSDNLLIEGTVLVTGKLPFLGTVALEGVLPAVGRSAVSYSCGNNLIGLTNDVPYSYIPPNNQGYVLGPNMIGLGR